MGAPVGPAGDWLPFAVGSIGGSGGRINGCAITTVGNTIPNINVVKIAFIFFIFPVFKCPFISPHQAQ
jgi:hypothetical protein